MSKRHPIPGLPSPCLPGRSCTGTKGTRAQEGHHTKCPSHLVLSSGQALHGRRASGHWSSVKRATLVQSSGAVSPHSSASGHTAWGTYPHTRARCHKCSQILTSKVTSRAKPAMPLPGAQGLWAHSDPRTSSIASQDVTLLPSPEEAQMGMTLQAMCVQSSAQPCAP